MKTIHSEWSLCEGEIMPEDAPVVMSKTLLPTVFPADNPDIHPVGGAERFKPVSLVTNHVVTPEVTSAFLYDNPAL